MNASLTGNRGGVSIIIPAYESQATARATLESLRGQTFRDFEVILVDSGHSDEVERIAAEFPEVRYHHSKRQLLPHEARNLGVGLAHNELLVFTDPDIVAAPDWLEKLLSAHERTGQPISGAVASLSRDWLATGVHFAKFDIWVPGGPPRTVPVAASVNFLCRKEMLTRAGGFDGSEMIGDTLLSWDLAALGLTLQFAPDAVVYHDHRSSFSNLLRERFTRGADFGRLRSDREEWSVPRTLGMTVVTILPLRLVKLVARSIANSIRGGCFLDAIRTLPIIAAGHAAWLGGEISQYWQHMHVRSAAPQPDQACM